LPNSCRHSFDEPSARTGAAWPKRKGRKEVKIKKKKSGGGRRREREREREREVA